QAVLTGLRSGRAVVIAAAIIMISVFGGFIFAHDAMIRPMGFGLAVGVLARPDLPGIVAANRAVLEAAAWVVAALVLLPGTVRPLWR
ncbi:hypothetical protein Q8G52_19745, partial [Acinetobacter baumannii]|uniref:hypothetical protein n=1 Tax=Acinetobacter baumannii TaxID=470 RepID=UPI00273213D7